MKLDTLEDLSKLFDLCQKKGIEQMTVSPDGISFKVKDNYQPPRRKRRQETEEIKDELENEERALFWSSDPVPHESESN